MSDSASKASYALDICGLGDQRIAVVIPCYRVRQHILSVIESIPPQISVIYCVDDACPEGTGLFLQESCRDDRVRIVRHELNKGVGGAMMTGYRAALKDGADLVIKLDGDGQMDTRYLTELIEPILAGAADYTKGNRFYRPESLKEMPARRLLGNAFLSFMSKVSSGYWQLFDPTNGYTAISAAALRLLPFDKISQRYFFESDMLFRLGTVRAVVRDIAMDSRYENTGSSSLKIHRILLPFFWGHIRNFIKRFLYNYFVRDFNLASILTVLGIPLLLFGVSFGLTEWWISELSGAPATAGTVMLAALPIIIGLQMILSAVNYDISNVPTIPLSRRLLRRTIA